MSFWTDDLPPMLADFGTTVTRANRSSFTALFDRQFQLVGDPAGVESFAPALTCLATDVATAAHGDVLTVDGDDYTVRSIQPDGTGVTVLILEAA